jgi:hypothetical protein
MRKPIYPIWYVRCFNVYEDWYPVLTRASSQYRAEKKVLLDQDSDCVYTQASLYDSVIHGSSDEIQKLGGDL